MPKPYRAVLLPEYGTQVKPVTVSSETDFDALDKGVSQTPTWVANWAWPIPILRFVNLRKSEAEPEQPVLLLHLPGTGEAEAFAQP